VDPDRGNDVLAQLRLRRGRKQGFDDRHTLRIDRVAEPEKTPAAEVHRQVEAGNVNVRQRDLAGLIGLESK